MMVFQLRGGENMEENRMAALLRRLGGTPLREINPAMAAAVRRRVVDGEALVRRLEVAAFTSAP